MIFARWKINLTTDAKKPKTVKIEAVEDTDSQIQITVTSSR